MSRKTSKVIYQWCGKRYFKANVNVESSLMEIIASLNVVSNLVSSMRISYPWLMGCINHSPLYVYDIVFCQFQSKYLFLSLPDQFY